MNLIEKYKKIKNRTKVMEVAANYFGYSLRHFRDEKFYKNKLTKKEVNFLSDIICRATEIQNSNNKIYNK